MQKVNNNYLVRLNAMSRNLLLSSLSTCRFTMLHRDHPFAVIIRQHSLVDPDHLLSLFNKIKNADNSELMEFTLEDEILVYTALDITCKFFLTELSDDMKFLNRELIDRSAKDFSEVRNTLIRGAQFVRDGMRETLSGEEAFTDRVELLDMVLTVQ